MLSRPFPRRVPLLAAALVATLASAQTALAQSCTTKTDCLDINIDLFDDPPNVSIRVPGDTVTVAAQEFEVLFSDDNGLNEASATYTLTPGSLGGVERWHWNKEFTSARYERQVTLGAGANTLVVRICDTGAQCTADTARVFYRAPPPPPARGAPVLSNQFDARSRNLGTCAGCSEATLSYSTPAYVSLDVERSVTLFYSTHQANPRGYVELEALDLSTQPAAYMTLQLRDSAGALVTLDNGQTTQHYQTGSGANRIAASFAAGSLPTGMYQYTATVTSHWSDGTSHAAASFPVLVPIVNEWYSLNGAGWTIAGLERVHRNPRGVMVTDGVGGVLWFAKKSCSTPYDCTYTSPPGEPSTLEMAAGTYQRTWPDGHERTYHGTGWMSLDRDRFGNQTVYSYDATLTKIASIQDPAGMATTFTRDSGGYLQSIVDPGGRTSTVGYAMTDLRWVRAPDNAYVLWATVDGQHRLTEWTDARGGVWNVGYDGVHRVSQVQGPLATDGVTSARPTTTVRSREASVLPLPGTGTATARARRVVPDSAYRRVTAPGGVATSIHANVFGDASRVAGPRDTLTLRYNANGQLRSTSDGRGNGSSASYEAAHPYRRTGWTVSGPDGSSTTRVQYGLFSQPDLVYSPAGRYDIEQDSLGQAKVIRRSGQTVASYTYDSRGRVTSASDAMGHGRTYTYQPSPGPQNLRTVVEAGVTTELSRDALGRQVRVRTAGIAGDSLTYDVRNRVVRVQDAAGGVTLMGYGGNGVDLSELTDPLGQVYRWDYNALGQAVRAIEPAGDTTRYVYQPTTGRLSRMTNRRDAQITFLYDSDGRPTHRTADGATTTWTYDPDGRWMTAATPASIDTLRYDSHGKLTEAVTVRAGRRYVVRHTYDEENRPDSTLVTGSWGTRNLLRAYDARGRLEAFRDYTGEWTHIMRSADGLPDSVRLPTAGEMRIGFGFTPRHQLAGISTPHPTLSHAYGYDTQGRLKADSLPIGYGMEHTYLYDALDRVTKWDLHQYGIRRVCYNIRDCAIIDTDSIVQSLTFAWDSVGNPKGAPITAGNRLQSYGGYSMTYDDDGNLTRKYKSGFDQFYTWNALGQLTGVTRTGMSAVTYDYDGFGRRIRRVDQGTGAVVQYVYDGDDLILEVDGNGALLREYSHYPGIDQPHSMRQWAGGAGGAVYYYTMQQPGHVSGLVNANDQLVNEYRYTPFGAPANGYPVEGTSNPLQYMAREVDGATGLYYVRNRWYDPQLGRFISEDPIGLAGGINPYAYVGGDPIGKRDPLGLYPCSWHTVTTQIVEVQLIQLILSLGCSRMLTDPFLQEFTTSGPPALPGAAPRGGAQGRGAGGPRPPGGAPPNGARAAEREPSFLECVVNANDMGLAVIGGASTTIVAGVGEISQEMAAVRGKAAGEAWESFMRSGDMTDFNRYNRVASSGSRWGRVSRGSGVVLRLVAAGVAAYEATAMLICAFDREYYSQ